MPQLGLINNRGERVRFDDIPKNFRREDWPAPLPMLMIFARQKTIYQDFLAKYNTLNPGNPLRLGPSVTQLLKPPRAAAQESVYGYYEEPASIVKREMGTIKHSVIENNINALRDSGDTTWASEISVLHNLVDDWFVPCTIDCIDKSSRILDDWKFTSGYKVRLGKDPANWEIGGKLEDWTLQLNFYRLVLERGSFFVEKDAAGNPTGILKPFKFRIDGIYLTMCQTDDRDEDPIGMFQVPMLPLDDVAAHFSELLHRHDAAAALARSYRSGGLAEADFQARLEACAERDQWRKAPAYAVAKPGKAALKVFYADTEGGEAIAKHNAEALAEEKNRAMDGERMLVREDKDRSMFLCYKEGGKKPSKMFRYDATPKLAVAKENIEATRKEAETYAAEANAKLELYAVEHRPGEPIRCKDYCPVAGRCRQFALEAAGSEALASAKARWARQGEAEGLPAAPAPEAPGQAKAREDAPAN